jgi:hypothetical protein
MENDFELPPGITPLQREAFLKIRAAMEAFITQNSGKPLSQAYIDSQETFRKECKAINSSLPPGQRFGTMEGNKPEVAYAPWFQQLGLKSPNPRD